uniref:Alpha-ketoglutarate-dependent dioxygenase AlkB-like domain-containing protein n=1 Tax=Timema tahoe TaxID=61484 RepID=A0A7R9IFA9_9NEOP|nr:unnamed protein product [Timema tahoe]
MYNVGLTLSFKWTVKPIHCIDNGTVQQVCGLKPLSEWHLYELNSNPGQRYWVCRCLRDYTHKPQRLNLDAHGDLKNGEKWWELCNKSIENKQRLLKKLRWATLGYHHNWDSKMYSQEAHDTFPADLATICQFVARVAGFEDFSAEAAIVNFYHMDSTLSGHTDHSEVDRNAPLLSFRGGQECSATVLQVSCSGWAGILITRRWTGMLRYCPSGKLLLLGWHADHSEVDRNAPLLSLRIPSFLYSIDKLNMELETRAASYKEVATAFGFLCRLTTNNDEEHKSSANDFGQSAIFLIGGLTVEEKPTALLVESGDIVIMSGRSRLCYHGVPRITPASHTPWTEITSVEDLPKCSCAQVGGLCDKQQNTDIGCRKCEESLTEETINRVDLGDFVDIEFAAIASLKEIKDIKILQFRGDCQKFLVDLCNKLLHKCPLSYKIVKGTSCLSPAVKLNPSVRTYRITSALEVLLDKKQLSSVQADVLKRDYLDFVSKQEDIDYLKQFTSSGD